MFKQRNPVFVKLMDTIKKVIEDAEKSHQQEVVDLETKHLTEVEALEAKLESNKQDSAERHAANVLKSFGAQ